MQYSKELNPRSMTDNERYEQIIVLERARMRVTRQIEEQMTLFGKKSKLKIGRIKGRKVGKAPNDFNETKFRKNLKKFGIKP